MRDKIRKNLAILGSTGSIGTQTLEVVREHPDLFTVEVISALNNADLLIEQAFEFKPNIVVIGNENKYQYVNEALDKHDIKVYAGQEALAQVVENENVDMLLMALVGYAGLKPTLNAIEAGKDIAIANKETFVVAGDLVTKKALEKGVKIIPVDSEHSAIYQCLAGEMHNKIEKLILTASGGPFRGKDHAFLKNVKKEDALKHPNWDMGCKITIDSASLMNKGLEVIEAHWLFGMKAEDIEVVIHPQSIIHSMVQFEDGSIKAQMGLPDMKLPIQYALSFPHRISSASERFDFTKYPNLSFEKPDTKNFRNLALAYDALRKGGNMPCILNAANEIVVSAFLKDKISFLEMPDFIEDAMANISFNNKPSYQDYVETDRETRLYVQSKI